MTDSHAKAQRRRGKYFDLRPCEALQSLQRLRADLAKTLAISRGISPALLRGMATEQEINRIAHEIIGGGIALHMAFGPGCFESTYSPCLAYEMKKRGLQFEAKVEVGLRYEELWIPDAYEADFIVEDLIVVEIKALQTIAPVHLRQLRTYLTLTGCPLGLLMNFGEETMRTGVHRVVNNFPHGTRGTPYRKTAPEESCNADDRTHR